MLNLQNIKEAKNKLLACNTQVFQNTGNSFRLYLNTLKVNDFRHITALELNFDHPVTVLTGTNKIGKTSILLLIACSHYNFFKYDSTKPTTILRRHTWRDVLTFTSYETVSRNYSYELFWRVGPVVKQGEGKRLASSKAWTGLGKYSAAGRINAQIQGRDLRLIDLERLLPARNFSKSLIRKVIAATGVRVNADIEQAFAYIFDIPSAVEIKQIGSHINKVAYLITYSTEPYSSFNAASGEESLINILVDIFDTPQDSIILIDEIEAGFHPSVQRKLADIIQYISRHHKKQFILTTHSPSLLAALPQKSRKFIDKDNAGVYHVIDAISVNAAFSKMDSKAYPLLHLYCEDVEAEFIIKNLLIKINTTDKYYDRLVNIIKSGPINEVKNDYLRHKHNFSQMRIKMGYCCVFDGDYQSHPDYSVYYNNPSEFTFFLSPFVAPEKFLVSAYLHAHPNTMLAAAMQSSDHHVLFQEMANLGLATDSSQARQMCWDAFKVTAAYTTLEAEFTAFILNATTHFSTLAD